jgi:ABC-type polysaccharide transport system permease subunit
MMKGTSGSPWVGLKNYQDLFADMHIVKVIINTLLYNLLFACFCFVLSMIGGFAVSAFSNAQ